MSDGLLVVGDVVTDIVARHRTPLAPATDTAADIAMLPGGAGANVACWAAQAGAEDVRLLARVGSDGAEWHREALIRSGVRPHLRVDGEAPTAVVIALVDATAERTLVTDSGASLRLSPDDWHDTLLDGVAHLHLSGYLFFSAPSHALARRAMAAARARAIPVSVDPASTGFLTRLGVDRFLQATTGADFLFPNQDEARLLTGVPDPVEAARKLSLRHAFVAVKRGPEGAVIAENGDVSARIPAPPTTPVDTTGAGDAFTGAFLAARLSGADPVSAATSACRTAAQAVTHPGGRPPPRP